MKLLLTMILSLVFISCASTPPANEMISESKYEEIVQKHTRSVKSYSGLYNTVQFNATLHNTEMMNAVLAKNAQVYQWDATQLETEKQKMETTLNSQTEIILSFFTPERKHDDLHRNKTLWKIFIDAGGKRYEGKATKIKLLTSEVQNLYPEHNRWSTAYKLTFPVSAKSIESSEIKLTLTGPVGSETVTY